MLGDNYYIYIVEMKYYKYNILNDVPTGNDSDHYKTSQINI